MKNTKLIVLCALSLSATALFAGSVPSLDVVVSDSANRLAYRGRTQHDGTFHTPTLRPGNYVVQLSSNNPAINEGTYAVVASAGRKKTVAQAVEGEKFSGGGIAMRVRVERGLNISGQVAPNLAEIAYRQNGRLVTASAPIVGTNIADARDNRYNIIIWTPEEVYRFQERDSNQRAR